MVPLLQLADVAPAGMQDTRTNAMGTHGVRGRSRRSRCAAFLGRADKHRQRGVILPWVCYSAGSSGSDGASKLDGAENSGVG
jgi:hypothetical protein